MEQEEKQVIAAVDQVAETPLAAAGFSNPIAVETETAQPESKSAVAVETAGDPASAAVVEPAKLYDENGNIIERAWYIVQTFSGQEFNVKLRVEQMIKNKNFQDRIFKILVPEEQVVEVKDNRRVEKMKKMYPGYVFVECLLDDGVWFEIRRIAGVAKFVGYGSRPTPVVEKDMLRVLRQVGEKGKKIEVDYEIGETIKVISGPFRGYTGSIIEYNAERGKLKTKLSIFGRETPVELDFNQAEKVSSL